MWRYVATGSDEEPHGDGAPEAVTGDVGDTSVAAEPTAEGPDPAQPEAATTTQATSTQIDNLDVGPTGKRT